MVQFFRFSDMAQQQKMSTPVAQTGREGGREGDSTERSDEEIRVINLICEQFIVNMQRHFNIGVGINLYSESPTFYNVCWSTAGQDRHHKYPLQLLSQISPLDYDEDTSIFVSVDGAKKYLSSALSDGASSSRDLRIFMALDFLVKNGCDQSSFIDLNRYWRLEQYHKFCNYMNQLVLGRSIGNPGTFFFTKVSASVYVKYYKERFVGDDGEFIDNVVRDVAAMIRTNSNL